MLGADLQDKVDLGPDVGSLHSRRTTILIKNEVCCFLRAGDLWKEEKLVADIQQFIHAMST